MRAVAIALPAGAAACSADDPGDYVLWADEQMRLDFPEHIDADGFVITRVMPPAPDQPAAAQQTEAQQPGEPEPGDTVRGMPAPDVPRPLVPDTVAESG